MPADSAVASTDQGAPAHDEDVFTCGPLRPRAFYGDARHCKDVAHKGRDHRRCSPGCVSGGRLQEYLQAGLVRSQ